jgi:TonB family protein
MNHSAETRTGWLTSLAVHAILLILLVFINVPEIVENQDFIEVIWGTPAVSMPAPVVKAEKPPGATEASPRVTVQRTAKEETRKPSQPVILPERYMIDPMDDVVRIPRSEKLETPEEGTQRERVNRGGVGERETATGRGTGERDQIGPPGPVSGTPVGPVSVSPGAGGDVDKGVSFSIQWIQGGTRRKISGELPKYPPGVNIEAQIKILTVVLPDGSVKSAQPAQKAHTALEEAAMKEVRFWKFEPLRASQPQEEQSCVVTFLFTLQ